MLMLEKVRQAEEDIGSRINNMLMDNSRSQSAVGLLLPKLNFPISANFSMCVQAEKECSFFPSSGRRSVSSDLDTGFYFTPPTLNLVIYHSALHLSAFIESEKTRNLTH